MKLVISQVVLHDFITGVEQHVAGCTWNGVLQVIHWKHRMDRFMLSVALRFFLSCSRSLVAVVTTPALTFVIGELQVVVHGGDKLLYDKTPDDRRQVAFAPHLPPEDLDVVICQSERGTTRQRNTGTRQRQQRGANRPAMEG